MLCLTPVVACSSGGAAPASVDNAEQDSNTLVLTDPTNDDKGPGTYVYPTNQVYVPGSFDLKTLEVEDKGSTVEFRVTVNQRIDDAWDSKAWGGNGFSIQMAFIHIDTDRTPRSGATKGMPGTNVRFSEDEAWDRVVIISPQGPTRVNSEVDAKASDMKSRVVVPKLTRARGRTLTAVVSKDDLGGAPADTWGYQVLMQSNEGFPAKTDLLTRKVNEFEGEHRFGGGSDFDNDPHVMDIFAGAAKGEPSEADAQYEILSKYNTDVTEDVSDDDLAVVPMIYPGS